jgi:hypothetical protein
MARERAPSALQQKLRSVIKEICGSLDAIRANTTGDELDRKRNTIKAAANTGYDRCFGIAEFGSVPARCGPFHKKLNGRRSERLEGRRGIFRRAFERHEKMDILAPSAQCFATCSQQMETRRFAVQVFAQSRYDVDHMLAIIQNNQDSSVTQEG